MIFQISASEIPRLLDFKQQRLLESGRAVAPAHWRQRAMARYQQLYRQNECVHCAYLKAGRWIALAGVLFVDEAPFLSTRVRRQALFIDEYVEPDFREHGVEGQLRDALLKVVAARSGVVRPEMSPHSARLAVISAAGFRL